MGGPIALTVLRATLTNEIPISGCELTPYVLLRRADGTHTTDIPNVPEEAAPVDGAFLRHRWMRGPGSGRCCVHAETVATLQCIGSRKFYCNAACFHGGWREWMKGRENGREEGDQYRVNVYAGNGTANAGWVEVGRSRAYTPTAEDVGHTLKYECQPVDGPSGQPLAASTTLLLPRVIAAPQPPTRELVPIVPEQPRSGRFNVLTYNVLADLYASAELYSYCPAWSLAWSYRRQNLVREILAYNADILCLQEIQSDHFEEFFAPALAKHGYTAVYKKKTAQVFTGNAYAIDGCAIFFKKDRFTLIKKYEVEFNKAAMSLSEHLGANGMKKEQLSRLMKDNVALIVVLEALEGAAPPGPVNPAKRQLLCVANTHIHANPEMNDVKLWQVQTLLKGLEKIDASAEIPMVVCGDFNSVPGSAAHSLLATGRVDPNHPELNTDPLGILRPHAKLCHKLPLISAYTNAMRPEALSADVQGVERLRKRLETSGEPIFSNITRDFMGTLDYLFFTANSLAPTALLELPSEAEIRGDKGVGLPSSMSSSDHIALMATFQWLARSR